MTDECGCRWCWEERDNAANRSIFERSRFVVCVICGNKRCPHATHHKHACTNSNDSGQPGSIYGDPDAMS